MANSNTVIAKCKYCGREFTTDVRHPHASCCGSLECQRVAARDYSKRHYSSLRSLYASCTGRSDPYHRMLDRKKKERQKRQQVHLPISSASIPSSSAGVSPRTRPVSTHLLFSVLEMVFSFINATADPDENHRCLLVNLERAARQNDSPGHLTEMRNFIELFHVQFPHICSSVHGCVPQVCSSSPS